MVQRPDRLNARRATALRLLGGAAAVVVVLFLAGVLPYGVARVGLDSMSPTLREGDRIVLAHAPGELRRGDLVVLAAPDGSGALLKRVAAVGGDRVAIDDGVLVVNGTPVVEPYFDQTRIDGEYFGPESIPPGTVWVLGDNRGESIDSRAFGAVPVESVVGRVVLRLWPSPQRF